MDVVVRWRLPKDDFIKINVHSFFSADPLPNGNTTDIGIVFRDDKGTIVRMYAGTLKIQEARLNEFHAMIYGLRKALFLGDHLVELETDHAAAYWEWRLAPFDGVVPEHQYAV